MIIFAKFNILLRIFYLYGLAPITIIKISANDRNYSFLIPATLTSILSVCISLCLLNVPHRQYGPIGLIINYLTLLFSVLMTFSVTGQCFFHKTIYNELIQLIQKTTNSFSAKFSIKLPLQSIYFRYRLKALLLFGFFFGSQGLVIIEVWCNHPSRSIMLPIVNALLRSMFPVVVLHFILYNDIIVMLIQELNRQVRNHKFESMKSIFKPASKFEFMKKIKLLHMDTWRLVVRINVFFGWSLLLVILYGFIFMIKQMYFLFTVLHVKDDINLLSLIGKIN